MLLQKIIGGVNVTGFLQRIKDGTVKHNINHQLALIKLSIKHLAVQFINQVQLIKIEIITVLQALGQLGQRLLTIAHKIHQHVIQLLKQGN
jgi:hypothetical protein